MTAKNFMSDNQANNLLIVDALNLAFRWKHRGVLEFSEDYQRTVSSLATSYDASRIVLACDWGSSTYRKGLYPDYKGNREKLRESQTQEEKDIFAAFFAEFEHTIDCLEDVYTVFRFRGVEADDIAGYMVKNRANYGYDGIWLISGDKDWDQLVQDGVSKFSTASRKEVRVDNWSEHYSYPPEHFLDVKTLEGDSGDNILGINGIGPVRAAALIERYGSVMDLYCNVPLTGKAQYIQKLNEQAERIPLNLQLVDLTDYCVEAIGQENIDTIEARMCGE